MKTTSPPSRHSLLSRVSRLILATLFVSFGFMATAPTASAAEPPRVAGVATATVGFMGINKLDGKNFICIGNGYNWPTKYGKTSTATDPQLAYLIHRYGGTKSNSYAAALAYIMKEDSAHAQHNRATPKVEQDLVKTMRQLAKDFAGPYKVDKVKLTKASSTKLTLENIGVRSAKGNYVKGADLTMKISGPARFSDGTKTLKETSKSSGYSRTLNITGDLKAAGEVTVTLTAKGLAGTTYKWTEKQATSYQRTVLLDPSSSTAEGNATVTWKSPRKPLTYTVSTLREVQEIDDDTIRTRDAITVKQTSGDWPEDKTLTVRSRLYRHGTDKPVTQATVPATATPVGSEIQTAFTKPGTKYTPWVTINIEPETVWYVWRERVIGSGSGVNEIHAWEGKYGVTSEMFEARKFEDPFRVTVETRTHALDQTTGTIQDEFDVSVDPNFGSGDWGTYEHPDTGADVPVGVRVTFDLYYSETDPVADQGDLPPDTAVLVGTVKSAPVFGETNGLLSPAINVPEEYRSGYLTWVASIVPDDVVVEGDDPVFLDEFNSGYGIAAESSFNPWIPKVVTNASADSINPGDPMVDELTVSGLPPFDLENPIIATCTAWGPFDQAPEVGSVIDPESDPLAGEGTVLVEVDGTYDCDAGLAPESGFYVFTEGTSGSTDQMVEEREDLTVYAEESFAVRWHPTVVTNVQAPVIRPGDEVIDVLTVGDIPADSSPFEATCHLWGPFEQAPEIGSEVNAIENEPYASGTVTITGRGDYDCSAGVVDESGFYVFTHETSSSEDGRIHESHDLTVYAEESQVVQWIPEVVTKASKSKIRPNAKMVDELTVTGLPGEHELTATCTAWGPFDSAPEVGSVIDPETDPKAGEGTITVTKNGTYKCEAGKAPAEGFYVFTEATDDSVDKLIGEQEDLTVYAEESFLVEGPPLTSAGGSLAKVTLVAGVLLGLFGSLGFAASRVMRGRTETK